jgi:hypothetical protein
MHAHAFRKETAMRNAITVLELTIGAVALLALAAYMALGVFMLV